MIISKGLPITGRLLSANGRNVSDEEKKLICKIIIDMIMTVLLLFLMARQITGDSAHEWLERECFFCGLSITF